MNGRTYIVSALVALLMLPAWTYAQGTGEIALRVAIETETVKGDLRAAIEQYKAIAAGRDRTLAAKALLRMADCYQKLGDAESRVTYERVVREFADQREAVVEARARLSASAMSEATPVVRQVAPSRDLGGTPMPSPDGRFVSFTDDTGNVSIRDLATGTNRRVTTGADWNSQYSTAAVISPDGRQVAYVWYIHAENAAEVRVVATAGDTSPIVALRTGIQDVPYKISWMPDGRQLQIIRALPDRTSQIGVVTIRDRSFRSIKSLEWRRPNLLSLSPDGRYLAYDVPAGDVGSPRDVIVLATDGSLETTAVKSPANDSFPLWMPDGSGLVFLSDRSGRNSLWMVPILNGRASGPAVSLKEDVGPISLLGMTRGGAVHYTQTRQGGPNVHLATLDGLRVTNPAVPMTERIINSNFGPTWSRDGQFLAYYSFLQISADTRSGVLVVRSASTGDERTVPLPTRVSSRFGAGPKWFTGSRSVLIESGDAEGPGFGFHRLSLDTGNVELLVRLPREVSSYDLSADGRTIFYALGVENMQKVVRYDIESRTESVLREVAFPDGKEVVALAISPDGTQLATTLIGGFVEVIPVAGGSLRKLFSPAAPELGTFALRQGLAWTPDQRFLLFTRGDRSLWIVPSEGGDAVKVLAEMAQAPSVHPDGKRLVFSAPGRPDANGVGGPFTWTLMALENVRSPAPATR